MGSHEIVIGEVEGDRREVVLPLFAEAVRQTRESANLHSHRKILSLDMRRANLLWAGASDD